MLTRGSNQTGLAQEAFNQLVKNKPIVSHPLMSEQVVRWVDKQTGYINKCGDISKLNEMTKAYLKLLCQHGNRS